MKENIGGIMLLEMLLCVDVMRNVVPLHPTAWRKRENNALHHHFAFANIISIWNTYLLNFIQCVPSVAVNKPTTSQKTGKKYIYFNQIFAFEIRLQYFDFRLYNLCHVIHNRCELRGKKMPKWMVVPYGSAVETAWKTV